MTEKIMTAGKTANEEKKKVKRELLDKLTEIQNRKATTKSKGEYMDLEMLEAITIDNIKE